MRVSIIIPCERPGDDASRSVAAALGQETSHDIEIVVVTPTPWSGAKDPRLRVVVESDRNPARRRNLGVAASSGEVVAFVDDDAFARFDWIQIAASYLDAHPSVVAIGGPDPAPDDSTRGELIADTLLATRWIGSGIACHEGRPGVFPVESAHDVALVNLLVRRDAFEKAGGFDESIGYIGEDTLLVDRLLDVGKVVYHDGVVVHHRRRSFPWAYVKQRWRYRLKTGELLVRGVGPYRRNGKIAAFLVVCFLAIALTVAFPRAGIALGAVYVLVTLSLGVERTRLPARWWPVIPLAFAVHHATYFVGILAGIAWALLRGRWREPNDRPRAR